jgi:hypothetical protein
LGRYQWCNSERWADRFRLTEDQNQKHWFENDRNGHRVVVPMSSGTAEPGDYVVVDESHSTRLNDFASGHKVVVQQPLHEAGLTGDLFLFPAFVLSSFSFSGPHPAAGLNFPAVSFSGFGSNPSLFVLAKHVLAKH